MQEAKELTITLKDNEKRTTHKFLIYEDINVRYDDPVILRCVAEAKKSFDGAPDNVKLKITMELL